MHRVEVVHECLHRLICGSPDLFICIFRGFFLEFVYGSFIDYIPEVFALFFLVAVVVRKDRIYIVLFHDFRSYGFYLFYSVFYIK